MQALYEALMIKVVAHARRNVRRPGRGPFAAMIVRGDTVVATGANQVVATTDPTAHAEVIALRRAARRLGTHDLNGCTLLSSCEPCPMCLAASYWARVDRIFFCASRTDAAAAGFDDALIYEQIPLPPDTRSIPSHQLLASLASGPFADWRALLDKVPY